MPKFTIPKLRQNQIAIVIVAIGAILVFGIAFLFFRKPSGNTGPVVNLTVWGTEPAAAFAEILGAYQSLRPSVVVSYRAMNPLTYEDTLLDALAAGEGPDIFVMPSTDIGKMRSKLVPSSTVTPRFIQDTFPKAVESDVVDGGRVYGLPLSLDTLVLLYNRDLLDGAGIVNPPATWDEVVEATSRLRAVDDQNQIQRSAIALGGTSASVPEAGAILSLLMLQNGAPLTNAVHNAIQVGEEGKEALRFYAQFTNPLAVTYTWNDELGGSLQQLADGKLAMVVDYARTRDAVRDLNPFIDLRIAPVPQATGGSPRSYGVYPLLAVSRQSANVNSAWDFVETVTTNKRIMGSYAAATKRSAALSTVISDQIGVPETQVAATQALQARSWFQWDGAGVRDAMDRAIQEITSGSSDAERASRALEQRLRALIR